MLYLFTTLAYAEDGGVAGIGGSLTGFLPIVVFIAIFYFLLIRPQQKGAKKHKEMLGKLEKGDSVITRGGIYGRVVSTKEDTVTVEIAENVKVKVEKAAIASKTAGASAE